MPGKVKIGGYKGGRGYNSWHMNWEGTEVYLRSKLEFIYASYLDHNGVPYLTECQTYLIDGIKYKPDFFIFNSEEKKSLVKIVEIKDTKREKEEYLDEFSEFFSSIGIEYEVLDSKKLRVLQKECRIDVEAWKAKCIKENPDINMRGEANPHYGVYLTDKQKEHHRKLGLKRFVTKESREKHGELIKQGFTPEKRRELSERMKELSEKKFLVITKKCAICNEEFEVKKNTQSEKRETCSRSCQYQLNKSRGLHNMAQGSRLNGRQEKKLVSMGRVVLSHFGVEAFQEAEWDSHITQAKKNGIISQYSGVSLATIKKYFGSFDEYYKGVLNEG